MNFSLHILGSLSALPHQGQITSAQILESNSEYYLIDCGEGTQIKLSEYGFRRTKMNTIFISHLHGDHVFGLPGLITSLGHFSRKSPLTIIGPNGLEKYLLDILKSSYSHLSFQLVIKEFDPSISQDVYSDKNIQVRSFPLFHRIPTMGYRFTEKEKPLNIKPEVIKKYGLNIAQIKSVKARNDIELPSGEILPNSSLTQKEIPPKSYAYCSDTSFNQEILEHIVKVDLLYHESTYLHELQELALERGHSTALEAGIMAKKAEAGTLILGHFSNRYPNLNPLLIEAKTQFENSFLAEPGKTFEIVKK